MLEVHLGADTQVTAHEQAVLPGGVELVQAVTRVRIVLRLAVEHVQNVEVELELVRYLDFTVGVEVEGARTVAPTE